jgi:hypothetical protein
MGNENAVHRVDYPLGFVCPTCRRMVRIDTIGLAYLEVGSGYTCCCPYCDKALNRHYAINVKQRQRVSPHAPSLVIRKD